MTTTDYNIDPKERLYNAVKQRQLYTKSFDEFKAKYNSPEAVQKLYNVVNQKQMFKQDIGKFYDEYYPELKKKEVGGAESVSAPQSTSKKAEPFPLLYERDKKQMSSDIRTPEQKAKAKMPEQPTISAGFTQIQSPKKDETFRVEITDKEAETEALESFRRGDHVVSDDSKDPVGELAKQINIKKYSYPEYKVTRKKIDLINNSFFPSGESAKSYLEQNQDMPPTNQTRQLAEKRYADYKKVEDALSGANSLEQAAINLAIINGDEQVKYLTEQTGGKLIGFDDQTSPIPMSMRGEKLMQLLMNKDLYELAEKNPQLKQSIKEETFNFPNRYPAFAAKLLAESIAQKRDEKGLNNMFANIVSKETTDKIVDELIEEGTFPSNYRFVYEKEIRPKLGTAQSIGRGIGNLIPGLNQLVQESPIQTPGLLESFEKGLEDTQVGIAKSIVNLPSLGGFPTIADALQPDQQQVFNVLKKQYETPVFEPSSLRHKLAMHGGSMAAFVSGIVGGTGALRAANIIKDPTLANAAMMVLATHGDTDEKAKALFPRNDFKQHVYIATMDGLNAAMGRFLPGHQIPKLMAKNEPTIANVLKKMVDGEITTSAAKNQIMQFVGETAKGTLGGAEFMGAISAADDALTQVLEGKDLNLGQTLDAGWEGFKLGLIATPVLAAAQASLKSNKGFRDQLLSIAEDPAFYKKLAEIEAIKDTEFAKIKDDVVKNIDYVEKVNKDLDVMDLSVKDKQKYMLNSLSELITQKKAAEATDPTIKKQLQKEAKEISEVNDAVLRGIPEEKIKLQQATKEVKEFYEYDMLSKAQKELLETKKTEEGEPKFDEGKVKSFLKFVAEQTNNITSDGKFDTKTDARKSAKFHKAIVELANEMFPEYKKIADEHDAMPKEEVAIEEPQPKQESSISVIPPSEVKQPTETITIKPKEGETTKEPTEKPKVRVTAEQLEAAQPPKEPSKGEAEPPISEPPKGGGVFSERPSTELSHRGLQNVANEFSLPDVKTRDRKSDVELRQEARETVDSWAEKGEYVKKVERLVERAENGEVLTDKERVILEGHLANVQQQAREIADKNSPEYDSKLSEIKRLKDAGEKTRSEAGAALRIPAGGSRPRTVEDAMIEAMDDVGTSKLTEKQKETVSKQFEDLQKAKDDFDAYMAKREGELAQKEAEAKFTKEKATTKKTKKTREDYVTERKSLKEELAEARKEHDEYLKQQGIQKSGFGSLTGKEAKIIGKIVRSYAEEGITKLNEVVEKVLEEIKGVIPDIKESDVRDVIAGRYEEKKPTRNDLAATLRNLKLEQQYLNEIERLEAGGEPVSEKRKIQRNKRLDELRAKIKEFDKSKLADRKEKIKSRINEINEKIKSGDFSEPEKKQPAKLDAEGQKLRDEYIRAKQRLDARRMLWQRQNEGFRERSLRLTAEVANIPRTLMTIADFSALLRQNIFFSAGHPLMTLKNTPDMFKAFVSPKVYDRWFDYIENSPRYGVAKESRLALADTLSHDLSKREEAFMSTLPEKVPGLGKIVKGSERSYTMLLNKMRWDMFNYFVDKMEARGLTFENAPKQYKALAEYVNNATGRSDFGETLNRVAPIMSGLFFSPRLIASRVNMLTYWAQPRFWRTLPREAKIDYFRNWASLIAIGGTILALAKMGGADVEDDPRSSDFGKIRDGNTRWDIWGGAQPYVRVLWQLKTGQRKSTRSGEIYDLSGDDIFGDTRMDVGMKFFRNKLAPVPGAAVDMLSGRTGVGDEIIYEWGGAGDKEISIDQYIKERLLPMTITGTQEAIKDRGLKAILDVGIPNIFGVGTQTYDSKPAPKKRKKQRKPTKSD